METKQEIIQYVPFISFVHPSFWHTLTEVKLDVDKLNETTKTIYGRFTCRSDIPPVFEVDGTSFNSSPQHEMFYNNVQGTIINKNTIEEFKNLDKALMLNELGKSLWTKIKTKSWISEPSTLLNFFILSFADLKKFHYYYWFAFPVPSQPTLYIKENSKIITSVLSNKEIEDLEEGQKFLSHEQTSFFIAVKEDDKIIVKKLSEFLHIHKSDQEDFNFNWSNVYIVYYDASTGSNPGWPLRIFMAALLDHCPSIRKIDLNVIGLRCDRNGKFKNSITFVISAPSDYQSVENAGWVGWERNDKGNFGPKLANMSTSMDPVKLADTSSDLNIKLMKWRLVPDLDTDIMKNTKCLLLGAGTLGCQVARNLLAWGFRHMTFIDNGKVSYSNPTRQVLFNYQDCLNGGRKKADAAADNIRQILPTVNSFGICAHIPMPGHPVGESLMQETMANVEVIREAIESHDVIFLLLDTREARWLPTLLAAHYGKIAINAALGFDSYLVMRHGSSDESSTSSSAGAELAGYISGQQLGCYFCNDVTAPGNSLKDRTLDQQCTVTRPGVSAIAGALAVEILVALLQHPLQSRAPAAYNLTEVVEKGIPPELEGVLGPIPHSVRGFLHSYQSVTPTCAKFKQCIACSDAVIGKYREEGLEFLLKVFNSGTYLEEVTGLSELHLAAEMSEILTLSDEED